MLRWPCDDTWIVSESVALGALCHEDACSPSLPPQTEGAVLLRVCSCFGEGQSFSDIFNITVHKTMVTSTNYYSNGIY